MKKRIIPWLLLCVLILSSCSSSAVSAVFGKGGSADAWLLKQTDDLVGRIKSFYTYDYLKVAFGDDERSSYIQDVLSSVTSASGASQVSVMIFDNYVNNLKAQYDNGGGLVMDPYNNSYSSLLRIVNAYGTDQMVLFNSIRESGSYSSYPESLSGKRALVLLNFGQAVILAVYTSETPGLIGNVQVIPVIEDGSSRLTYDSICATLAAGNASRTDYQQADLKDLLDSSSSPSLTKPVTNSETPEEFLRSSSDEMLDMIKVCRTEGYFRLHYSVPGVIEAAKRMEELFIGSHEPRTWYKGIQYDRLASLLSDASDFSIMDELGIDWQPKMTYSLIALQKIADTGSDLLAFNSVSQCTAFYASPENFSPSAVLIPYSDEAAVFISYQEAGGIITATASMIVFDDSITSLSFTDFLAQVCLESSNLD